MDKPIEFCKGGGCTAKLGPQVISHVLEKLPPGLHDDNLLIGYDTKDDAAVYQVAEDLAVVQTLDFFPPMVEDPRTFGQIAAANAMSDVYAMGGTVKTALNIVCFPEAMSLNILGEIMLGGAEKVSEAGGVLAGGHSIADDSVKYGLSVMGFVDPRRMLSNIGGHVGDHLILTKSLGAGIVCTAERIGQASSEAMTQAIQSMLTLNKSASEILQKHVVHACTDVTGFSLLGHLHEMMGGALSCEVYWDMIPVIQDALAYADEFYLTAAAQRNRNYLEPFVQFSSIPFAAQEVLLDPQTSGGLLAAVDPEDAPATLKDLRDAGLPACDIGIIRKRAEPEILVVPSAE